MKPCMFLSFGLAVALSTACGHQGPTSAAGQVAASMATSSTTSAASLDPCKLLTKDEAETVLDNPGSAEAGNSGISKECKYSRDTDYLELSVNDTADFDVSTVRSTLAA